MKLSSSTKRILNRQPQKAQSGAPIPTHTGRQKKKIRLYVLQKGQCAYCSNVFPIHRLTYDHVVRKREGGSNHISNLVLACYPCNVRRELPENARESVMIRWAAWHREYLSAFGL